MEAEPDARMLPRAAAVVQGRDLWNLRAALANGSSLGRAVVAFAGTDPGLAPECAAALCRVSPGAGFFGRRRTGTGCFGRALTAGFRAVAVRAGARGRAAAPLATRRSGSGARGVETVGATAATREGAAGDDDAGAAVRASTA